MPVQYGTAPDLTQWMQLVAQIRWNFPGLETEESMEEHRRTVLRFMEKRQALCVKDGDAVVGVLLFSRDHNMICCLGVSPQYRRRKIASQLLTEALHQMDRSRDITVSTFRKEDPKGIAPRALYQKFGFTKGQLIKEFDYPNQEFILHP